MTLFELRQSENVVYMIESNSDYCLNQVNIRIFFVHVKVVRDNANDKQRLLEAVKMLYKR